MKKWYLCVSRGEIVVRPWKLKNIVAEVTEQEVIKGYALDEMPVLTVNQYNLVWDYFYNMGYTYTDDSGVDHLTNKGLNAYWNRKAREDIKKEGK